MEMAMAKSAATMKPTETPRRMRTRGENAVS